MMMERAPAPRALCSLRLQREFEQLHFCALDWPDVRKRCALDSKVAPESTEKHGMTRVDLHELCFHSFGLGSTRDSPLSWIHVDLGIYHDFVMGLLRGLHDRHKVLGVLLEVMVDALHRQPHPVHCAESDHGHHLSKFGLDRAAMDSQVLGNRDAAADPGGLLEDVRLCLRVALGNHERLLQTSQSICIAPSVCQNHLPVCNRNTVVVCWWRSSGRRRSIDLGPLGPSSLGSGLTDFFPRKNPSRPIRCFCQRPRPGPRPLSSRRNLRSRSWQLRRSVGSSSRGRLLLVHQLAQLILDVDRSWRRAQQRGTRRTQDVAELLVEVDLECVQ